MRQDPTYLKSLDEAEGPSDPIQQKELEKQMKFSYRQVVGELIYVMTTCRPDISPSVTRLSQHNDNPAKEHYLAAKAVLVYLYATRQEGIHYW